MPQAKVGSTDAIMFYEDFDYLSDKFKHIPPNVFTIINFIPTLLTIYFWYHEQYIPFYIFLTIRMYIDCFDGYHARRQNMVTDLGDKLDHVQDFLFLLGVALVLNRNKKSKLSQAIGFSMLGAFVLFFLMESAEDTKVMGFFHDNAFIWLLIVTMSMIKCR